MTAIDVSVYESVEYNHCKVRSALCQVRINVDVGSGYDTKKLDELRSRVEDILNNGLADALGGGAK